MLRDSRLMNSVYVDDVDDGVQLLNVWNGMLSRNVVKKNKNNVHVIIVSSRLQ